MIKRIPGAHFQALPNYSDQIHHERQQKAALFMLKSPSSAFDHQLRLVDSHLANS